MGGGQHVRISMDEVRALDSETARLLHQRLCGRIDPAKPARLPEIPCAATSGRQRPVVLPCEAPPAGARGVAGAGRAGLDGNQFAAGKYDITRPKAAGDPPTYCKQDIFIFYSMAYFPANW